MPDITMCNGGGCPLQDSCYRYLAMASELQTYFLTPPYKEDDCDYFWLQAGTRLDTVTPKQK